VERLAAAPGAWRASGASGKRPSNNRPARAHIAAVLLDSKRSCLGR
jgi:hypothetical protein